MRKINLCFLTLLFLIFSNPSIALDQELRDIVDTIDAAKKDFNDVDTSEVIEAVKMDKAFEQIDKVTEFVKESLEEGNEESAIKALEFIEKSLAGTNALVPQEFSSDMSKADMGSFGEENMKVVNEITAEMKEVKEEKLNDLISGMVDISEEGIDAFGIVETLDQIGIETIDVAIAVEKKKEMAIWTKEEWANSWKGDILTDDGKQIISDDEINLNISTLEQKLQANNLEILDKKNSLNELQTKIDPLSGQITDLKTQKTDLLAKYNEEILKQSSTILSDEEINKSKELADQFNSELSDLSSQIKTAEQQSNSLQQQVQSLNLELANEISTKSQLEQNISNLNNQLRSNQNLLTKKELELDQLKSSAPNLNKNLNELNTQLEDASLQKDFVQVQFERSIDKEVEAFNHYAEILWDGPSSTSKKQEVDFAMREVSTMLDNDPKKQRILEIEKYGIYAGLSDTEINKGIDAIQNDDWEAQKEVTKNIYKGLSKSSEWNVSVPSNAEINVMIAEEKAIQEASYASLAGLAVQDKIHEIINEKTKDLQNKVDNNMYNLLERYDGEHFLKNPSCTTCYYSSFNISEEQRDLFEKKTEEFINSNEELKNTLNESVKILENYNNKLANVNVATDEISGSLLWQEQNMINGIKQQKKHIENFEKTITSNALLEKNILSRIGFEKSDVEEFKKSDLQSKIATSEKYNTFLENLSKLRNSDASARGNMNVSNIDKFSAYVHSVRTTPEFESNLDKFYEKNPQVLVKTLKEQISIEENKISNLKLSTVDDVHDFIKKEMDDAKAEIDKITSEEIAKVPEYNFSEKVAKILNEVPTFGGNFGTAEYADPAMMRAKLYDLVDGTSEARALEALRTAMSEIGDKPVSEYMTGPYWEMSNVKAAAILKSKKYSWIDDYAIYNHYDPLDLSQKDLELAENQLSSVLKTNNPKLDALNEKIAKLSEELEQTKSQSLTVNDDIKNLESELASLKSSEGEIQNQISDLSNQFSSKENLIAEKTQNLASLQEQLNPLSDKMNELEGQRADLDAKLNTQLTTIANQIESQGQATDEANALKAQFENQIAQLDSQLKTYEDQSTEINSQLSSLTTELTNLETETPDISNQISKLNQELNNVIEIKADLAMTQAIKSGINVNEKIVEAVAKLENKSIVQIEGTELMRIVDTDTLTDDVGDFEAPVGTFTRGNQVYLAGAVTREQILSVGKIDATGDLNIQLSEIAAEKINSGMFGLETAKGLVATDDMTEGTYSLIDPKTGRQVLDSHTGNALYGGIICSGDQCGPSGDLGKKVAASGYVFVRTGDINQGGMCSGGDCAFNISKSELETFNQQIADGVESPFGYDDALAAATVNTKGLVLDSAIGEAAGEVTKEFFSGKFNVIEDVGGQEALLQKAKDTVARLQAAQAAGEKIDASAIQTAQNQVAAEQSVLDAVNAAKEAAASTSQVASVAASAASEAASVATEVAQEVAETQRAAQNVNQLIRYSDGSIHHLVGKTGVNVSAGQEVIWSGLTSESHSPYGSESKKRAIEEASKATGIAVDQIYNPEN